MLPTFQQNVTDSKRFKEVHSVYTQLGICTVPLQKNTHIEIGA